MQLFLDSANLEEIKECLELGLVTGVTTNPSLLAKEKKASESADNLFDSYLENMVDISLVISKHRQRRECHLSVEALSLEPSKIIEQAQELKKDCSRDGVDLYVKVPFIKQTLSCIPTLKSYGVKTNLTALMSSRQGYLANKYNPSVISFFYNRMIDYHEKLLKNNHKERHVTDFDSELFSFESLKNAKLNAFIEIKRYWESYKNPGVQIICGSIRTTNDIEDLWQISNGSSPGIIVTAPYKIVMQMLEHEKTNEAVDRFTKDIEAWYKK